MKIGVIRFPGTNCDRDVYHAIELAGAEAVHLSAMGIYGTFSWTGI